ncbi:MAG TPA: T9SS type A sorting domain-containing protein, partial [Niastella sp.]|nr:T9SS type A sorting domain-containing protein [Niastella sp.]
DAVLKNEATGESWLPWVLNAGVHTDSLVKDAARKKDTLNTIEQLSIQAPAAGAYTIEVSGSHIATGTQPFALAYEIDTAAYFEWTFPIKEDPVRAGQTNVLRWQTTHAGKGKMEYTVDGTTWLPINDSIDLAQRYYKWVAPDTFAIARLRMGFSKSSPVLSDSFVMSNATTLQVGFACADSFMLFWNALPVPKYQLYNLDARYLEPVAQTSDTAILFKTDAQHSPYFSVAPIVNGKVGLRSFTINYTGQGSDCYFRSFYVQSQTENTAVFKLLIGTYYNIAGITLQKLETGYFTGLQTISNPHTNDFSFSDTVLTQGVNTYRIQIRLQNGNVVYSEPLRIYHFKNEPVIVYPNPAPQYTPVNLITNKAGRIRIAVYSAAGQLLHEKLLSELLNKATLAGFAKGFYFIRITEDDGTRSTQKMVVY